MEYEMAPSPDVVAWVDGVNSRPPSDDGIVVEIPVVGFHVTVCGSNAAVAGADVVVGDAVGDELADETTDGVAETDRCGVGVGAACAGAAGAGCAGAEDDACAGAPAGAVALGVGVGAGGRTTTRFEFEPPDRGGIH